MNELLCYMLTSMDSFEFSSDRKLWSIRVLLPWNTMAVVHHKLMWSFTYTCVKLEQNAMWSQVSRGPGATSQWQEEKQVIEKVPVWNVVWERHVVVTVSDTGAFLVVSNFLFQLLTLDVMTSQANEFLKYSKKPRLSSVLCGRISQHWLWL